MKTFMVLAVLVAFIASTQGDECRDLHDSNYCQAMQRESDECNRGSSKFAYVLCQETCGNCNFGDTPMKNLKDETDDECTFMQKMFGYDNC